MMNVEFDDSRLAINAEIASVVPPSLTFDFLTLIVNGVKNLAEE